MNATKRKLLLADDSATIRKVVEMTFADEGVDVATVADGPSAMEKFVEIQPDIVLVDTTLAGTNGYQICEMIKQDATTRHIPVLLLVGSFEPFDHDAAERAGADGFMTKPFHSIRDLVARVSELLAEPAKAPLAVMPETEDIDSLYHKSFDGTQKIEDLETVDELLLDLGRNGDLETLDDIPVGPAIGDVLETVDDLLGDTGMDDELIEAATPAGRNNGNGNAQAEAAQPVKAFDRSPGALIRATPEKPRPVRVQDDAPDRPSEQLVELVAKRVVVKLSEQVIREIAQEAVPRITEKLIREALENESKT